MVQRNAVRRARRYLAATAVMLILAGAGSALAGYKEGKEAYDKKDYAAAWKELDPLAKKGDRDAQYLVGSMYHMGMGVPASYKDAAEWYRKSADAGKVDAIFTMGIVYEGGVGVARNVPEAVNWYRKSAERCFYPGMLKLADMFAKGRGVKKDNAQSYYWYTVAERYVPPTSNDRYELPIVRDKLSAITPKEQVADADRKAKAWKPTTPCPAPGARP